MRFSPRRDGPAAAGCLAVVAVAVVLAWPAGDATARAIRWTLGLLDPEVVLELAAGLAVLGLGLRLARAVGIDGGGVAARAFERMRAACGRLPTPLALTAVVSAAAVFRVTLGAASHIPKVLGDELIYTNVAKSWVTHGRPLLRGTSDIGHSTLYPLFMAPAFALAGDGASALAAARTMNALVVALTAVPAYAFARRIVPRGWALAVAALSVAVPWTAYAALTMTESLFYLVFVTYALVLAWTISRPTWRRQALMLATFAVLIGVRAQGLAVGVGTVGAILLCAAVERRLGTVARRYALTLAAGVVVLAVAAGAAAAGVAVPTSAYNPVFGSLSRLGGLLKWGLWSLGAFDVALGVVLLTAFPLAVAAMLRREVRLEVRAAGAVASMLALGLLGSVALLGAGPYGLGLLHERSLFYVTPLLLACVAHWLHGGLRRRTVPAWTCAVLSVTAVAFVPGRLMYHGNEVDVPSSEFFVALRDQVPSVSFRLWATAVAGAGAATFLAARRPLFPILTAVLAFAAVTAQVDYGDGLTSRQAQSLSWVDRALPSSANVTLVYVGLPATSDPCGGPAAFEQQQLSAWTEFFNRNVDRAVYLYAPNVYDGLAGERVVTGPGGLVLAQGRPYRPGYVILDTRQPIVGTRVARLDLASLGTGYVNGASLTLWRADPPLRLYSRADPLPPRGDGKGC